MQDDTGSRGARRRAAKTKTCAVWSACHVVFERVTSDYRRWRRNGASLLGGVLAAVGRPPGSPQATTTRRERDPRAEGGRCDDRGPLTDRRSAESDADS